MFIAYTLKYMVKAVIFDCFGVLVTDGWLPFVEEHFSGDAGKRRKAADYMVAVNRGMLDYRSLVHDVAELAGVEEAIAYDQIMRNTPNEPLFEFIAHELKPKFKIGLLSNTGRDRLEELFTSEELDLFDDLSLSYETGYLKPQPEAYQIAAEGLSVAVGECVFIDDQERRCEGARVTGMLAICYQDFPSMKIELERILAENSG